MADGDASLLPGRPEAPVYDATALLADLLAATARARLTSMRLPAFWSPALLARSWVTLQSLGGGRVVVGDVVVDRLLGGVAGIADAQPHREER